MKHLNQLKLLRRGLYRLEAILRLNRKLYSGKKIVDKVEKKVPSTPYELWKDKRQKENNQDAWDEAALILKRKNEKFVFFKWLWKITGFKEKTLWDILQLLMIPLSLVLISGGFQYITKQSEQQAADDKARQETLVKYLDQMSALVQQGLLKSNQGDEISTIARAKTIIVLQSLDPKRQHLVIQFLEVFGLKDTIPDSNGLLFKAQMNKAILVKSDLSGSNLPGAILMDANLEEADLTGTILSGAKLYDSNLTKSVLKGTIFSGADLRKTNFSKANLLGEPKFNNTDLTGAVFTEANFEGVPDFNNANLTGANFTNAVFVGSNIGGANFEGADISKTDFSGTILIKTDFRNAKNLTKEQLEGSNPPLICKIKIPEAIKIKVDRDCSKLVRLIK
jgi:uncharacterized protein YjbI with pentapeptide repeats